MGFSKNIELVINDIVIENDADKNQIIDGCYFYENNNLVVVAECYSSVLFVYSVNEKNFVELELFYDE